jgi:DNA-binding response OmpR family regulator
VRVLIAEDDSGLRDALVRGLRESGYVVDSVADGDAAMRYMRSYEYELAVLDWRMPVMSGLDQGADDYLTKPFDFGELLARMRALQRRPAAVQQPRLVVGDLHFDPATRTVRVGGQKPELTVTEFAILEMLVRRSPAVVARRSIAVNVWADEADAMGSNTIDVHLARLRSKLAGGMVGIETVRGVGYRIVAR